MEIIKLSFQILKWIFIDSFTGKGVEISTVIKIALVSLARNKTRSFLTSLGIIIGVASVISMVSLGQGAYYSAQESISKMGTNLIMIFPGSQTQGGVRLGMGSITTLNISDVEAITNYCKSVAYAAPEVRTSAQVVFSSQNWVTTIIGIGNDTLKIRNWELQAGRFFTPLEIRSSAKVCIIGTTVQEKLFSNLNPLGKIIRIKKIPFEVIGVLTSKGGSSMGHDQDDVIMVPYTTLQKRILGISHLHLILVSAKSDDLVEEAKQEIRKTLRSQHHLDDNEEDDFNMRTQADIANMASSTLRIINLLLGSIASVSLLVGGIGIMNIMLVSVTERTKEIGIRLALGAKRKDILVQFLTEALVLSLFGGLFGIIFGYFLAISISKFTEWNVYMSLPIILIAFTFSASVGIFFGLYPAYKASKLDPIDALRYE